MQDKIRMKNLKFILHFGGVFGDKGKISKRTRKLVENFALGGPFSKRQILSICRKLEKILQKSFRNQQVKVSPVFYLDKSCFLDVDIFSLEREGRPRFLETVRFPDNLRMLWEEYQDNLFSVAADRRKVRKVEKEMEREIEVRVKENLGRLLLILEKDKNPEKRATSAYLLSFADKPREVSQYLVGALEDSEHLVHNAAGWSLAKIAFERKIKISLKPIISLIHHPFPGCRNKGLVLLEHLLKEGSRKDLLLIKRLTQQRLLEISRSNQPNYYSAKQILKIIKK